MKKILPLLEIIALVLFILFLPKASYAGSCDFEKMLKPLQVSPASGNITTYFNFSGQIENCPNYTEDQATGLRLLAYDTNNDVVFNEPLVTDVQGNIIVNGVLFGKTGTFTVTLTNVGNGEELASTPPVTIKDTPNTKLSCGDTVPVITEDDKDPCPSECPATSVNAGEKRVCGGQLDSETEERCDTSINLDTLAECESTINSPAKKCKNGTGWVCDNSNFVPCKSGNDVKCIPSAPLPGSWKDVCTPQTTCKKAGGPSVVCTTTYRCETAVGPVTASADQFVKWLFGLILGLSGGIALLLIIYSGYKLMLSRGNPEKIQGAKETLVSTIVGLMFIIFSMVILEIIGVDILGIFPK
ncbi:MAG: hypothetical protein M1524_03485 [Patescibacteria group bacterium]|nr:hypothetical protein [Patescibacteria group bacterium]